MANSFYQNINYIISFFAEIFSISIPKAGNFSFKSAV